MVFNLVANDDASRAFDSLARRVELSNAAIDKHNATVGASSKALDDNAKSVDRNNSSLAKLSGTITTTSRGFGALATAAVAFGPAVGAAAAVATAGIIGLGGIVASTGAALGVFGLTAKSQFDGLSKGYQNIQKLKEQAAAAPAGSKQQIADYQKLATAQAEYSKTFGPAAAGMNNLQNAWAKWKQATAGQTNQVLADGLNLIAAALPKLRPLFDTGAAAARGFIDAIRSWVAQGGLDRAVTLLNDLAKQVFPYVAATMKNIASAASNLAPIFFDLGVKVAAGMANVSGAMATWAGNKGVDAMNSFMAYITANGPKVWELLKNLATAAINIARDLAPLAPVSLAIANALAQLIAAAPPGVIQAVAVAFVAYSLAMKGLAIAGAVGTAVKTLTSAMLGLDIAMDANPIGLVVIAIAALGTAFYVAWQKSAGFRDFIKAIGADILQMGIQALQGLKTVTDGVLGFMAAMLNGAAHVASALGQNWLADKLSGAANAITGFKNSTDSAFNGMINTMKGWQDQLTTQKATVASVSADVVNHFNQQGTAASNAKGALDKYTDSVRFNGVTSNAAQQARFTLISDLVNAGVNAHTAMTDVTNYTNAIANNGVYSNQARDARTKLINDIMSASGNARQGKADTDALTSAIQHHGTTSDAYRNARQTLINDLIASGVRADTARSLVDGLSRSVQNLPGQKNVQVNVNGSGQWSIAQGSLQQKLVGYAAGGRVTAGTSPTADDVLVRVSRDETIVSAAHSARLAPFFAAVGVPGYAAGGRVGADMPMWVARSYDATVAYGINALTKAMTDAINQAVAAAKAAAQAATAGTGGSMGDSGIRSGSAAAAQAFARSIMGQYGWGADQWPPWLYLGNQESGWNAYAVNASSGAYGIGQSLGHGHPYELGDYQNQVIWMANYIKGRYGSPSAAWGHEVAYNWYRAGSWDVPVTGPAVVHKGEMILPAELAAAVRDATQGGGNGHLERLIRQLIAVTASQGDQFARALDGAARRARAY
jgi:hypothetical protein